MLDDVLLLYPGTKKPLPGDGDKEDPIDLVLLLRLPFTGAGTVVFVFGIAPVGLEGSTFSVFFSSTLVSFLLGEAEGAGPHRKPFLILFFFLVMLGWLLFSEGKRGRGWTIVSAFQCFN